MGLSNSSHYRYCDSPLLSRKQVRTSVLTQFRNCPSLESLLHYCATLQFHLERSLLLNTMKSSMRISRLSRWWWLLHYLRFSWSLIRKRMISTRLWMLSTWLSLSDTALLFCCRSSWQPWFDWVSFRGLNRTYSSWHLKFRRWCCRGYFERIDTVPSASLYLLPTLPRVVLPVP